MGDQPDRATDWLAVGRKYLAANAAESGADVIIAGLCDEVACLRDELRTLIEGMEHNRYYDQRDAYFDGRRDERNGI